VKNICIGKPDNKGIAYLYKFNSNKTEQLFKDILKYSTSVEIYIFELLSDDENSIECLLNYLEN